jgi:hypothetical protein
LPRYYFVIQWPDREHGDNHGTVLPDDAAARNYAERVIRELKESGGYDDPGLSMIVRNEAGKQIFVIPFETRH